MAIIQSPLARSLQGGLIQSRVSGGVFGGGGIGGVGAGNVDEDGNKQILENNQSILFDIASGINGIRIQISALNESLNSIAQRISNDATLESVMAAADADYQRKLQERQVRIGQESALEAKIQAALTKPVVVLQNKVSSVFGNVGRALQTLFLGWFLNQGLDALQAQEQGNKDKLTSIRNEVLKALAFIVAGGGVLAIIKAAIAGVTRSILGLTSRIAAFVISGLFIKPFQMVINAIQGMWNKVTGAKPPAAPPKLGEVKPGEVKPGEVKPGEVKPKGRFGGMGGLLNVAFGGLDFLQRKSEGQTNLQAGAGAVSTVGGFEVGAATGARLGSFLGPWGALGGSLLGGIGMSMIGGGISDVLTGANKPKPQQNVQPMQTPMGNAQPQAPAYTAPQSLPAEPINLLPMALTPSPETTAPKPKPKPTQTTTPSAKPAETKPQTSMMAPTPAETKPAETKPAEISPAQTEAPPKEMPNVGPAPKPKTNVNVTTLSSSKGSSGPGASQKPATEVPNIPSSNPDNFYALYSQLNYNVVV